MAGLLKNSGATLPNIVEDKIENSTKKTTKAISTKKEALQASFNPFSSF